MTAREHPEGRGACDPDEQPCDGCAEAYAEPEPPDPDDERDRREELTRYHRGDDHG